MGIYLYKEKFVCLHTVYYIGAQTKRVVVMLLKHKHCGSHPVSANENHWIKLMAGEESGGFGVFSVPFDLSTYFPFCL